MASVNGNHSNAIVIGNESTAIAVGYNCIAKASLGSWLIIAERDSNYKILWIKSVKVDGKKIKANTFYLLKRGKFIKAKL
jgi:hypothetical protein